MVPATNYPILVTSTITNILIILLFTLVVFQKYLVDSVSPKHYHLVRISIELLIVTLLIA